jgi:DNA-binding transcriptional regulator YiaG
LARKGIVGSSAVNGSAGVRRPPIGSGARPLAAKPQRQKKAPEDRGRDIYNFEAAAVASRQDSSAYKNRGALMSAISPTELRRILNRLGITLAELARLLDVHPDSACRWGSQGIPDGPAAVLMRLLGADEISVK